MEAPPLPKLARASQTGNGPGEAFGLLSEKSPVRLLPNARLEPQWSQVYAQEGATPHPVDGPQVWSGRVENYRPAAASLRFPRCPGAAGKPEFVSAKPQSHLAREGVAILQTSPIRDPV